MVILPAFREAERLKFIDLIRSGAGAVDIHDAVRPCGFGVPPAAVSLRFVEREVARVDSHLRSHCSILKRYVPPRGQILDVGCGTGGLTVAMALTLEPSRVVGLDASASSITAAEVRAAGYGINAEFVFTPPSTPFPFPDNSFDLVTCVSVLETISTAAARQQFLAEIKRVLRSGGIVYLATPNPLRFRELHTKRILGDWRLKEGLPWGSTPWWILDQFQQYQRLPIGFYLASKLPRRFRRCIPEVFFDLFRWLAPWQIFVLRKS